MKNRRAFLMLGVLLFVGCVTSFPIDKPVVEAAWESAELVRQDTDHTLAVYYFSMGEEKPR
jgi:hypothetical protein